MQQTTLDSSGQLQQAKGKLGTINVSELSLQELQAYTSVLNSIILSEKAELEASVLRKTVRSENYKFWAVIVAPVVAVLITALTLWFQIKQFGENTRLAKQTAEDTQWREALGKLFQREGLVSA